MFFRLSTAITLTGGTMFLMWLGEQITSRGIGNGISLIILSGIVAELPRARQHAGARPPGRAVHRPDPGRDRDGGRRDRLHRVHERAQRRLLIQYPKRQVGNKMFEGQSSHLPLKLNTSGVIPPIFASSLLAAADHGCEFQCRQGAGMVSVAQYAIEPRPSVVSAALSGA